MSDDAIYRPPAVDTSRVFLVRHGATEANERRPFVLQGCEIDGPLTETGRRQAAALTGFLARVEFAAVYCSPMLRARETVAAIADSRSLPVKIIDDLRECHVGQWAGMSWDEIRERDPERSQRFLADPATEKHPGGESYLELQERVMPPFRKVLIDHPGQNVLVLAHNMVNRALLATELGIDLRHARRIRQMNCCINILQHCREVTEVVTVNSIWHLAEIV